MSQRCTMDKRMRPLTVLLAMLALPLGAPAAPPPYADGWVEATAIVRAIAPLEGFFVATAGYQRLHAGPVPRQVLDLWGLGPEASGDEVVLAEPGARRGFVRLVELSAAGAQSEARSAGQFFDTGGIMGLNVRVRDIDLAFERVRAAGWRPLSEPVRFSVEQFSVAEAIFLGPDGLVIGLIERERPALGPEWQMPPGKLSRPNNAFVVTADMPLTLKFYETRMRWPVFLRDRGKAGKTGMNLYGWPHNLVESVERDVAWVHPGKGGEGSIALMRLRGVTGRDFANTAAPPNFGWIGLRTWSVDTAGGAERPPSAAFVLQPYGCIDVTVHIDPASVRLERLRPAVGCNR